jgi:hypothetical protein
MQGSHAWSPDMGLPCVSSNLSRKGKGKGMKCIKQSNIINSEDIGVTHVLISIYVEHTHVLNGCGRHRKPRADKIV